MPIRTTLGALLLLLSTVGCAADVDPTPSGDAWEVEGSGDDLAGDWRLVRGTLADEPMDIGEHRVTLSLTPGQLGGTAACNHYGGTARLDGDRLVIADMAMTAMACLDPAAMELERRFMEALGRVETLGVRDGDLVLEGDDVELRFERVEPPPAADLVDTVWILDTVTSGGVASSPVGDRATLELRSDGELRGSTGCRAFDGTWVERADQILATRLASTDEACAPAIADQDRIVLEVIGDGFTPSIEGDRLTIEDPGGSALVYRASE